VRLRCIRLRPHRSGEKHTYKMIGPSPTESPPVHGSIPPLVSGKAFGTGNHATTRLCMKMIETYLEPGDRFLDVGTGSGILMVVAAGLGAGRVTGFDRHPFAVAAARDNLNLNGVDNGLFDLLAATDAGFLKTRFDVVAVNILPEVIVGLLEGVSGVIRPGGFLLCAGMIQGNTHRVSARMKTTGFKPVKIFTRGMWVGMACRFFPDFHPLQGNFHS